jgi:short-subunit dehydrogenase
MRTPEKEEELTKLDHVLVTRLDVQDHQTIEETVKLGIEKFGKIDVLLNNAGYGAIGVLEAASMDKIRRQFEVNVLGLIDVTKEVLPHFRKNKNGIVINISSIAGKMTFPLGTLYHGTKFAVEGMSEALSFELEAIGCKMKIVEPGRIKTDFGSRSLDFFNDESMVEYQELVAKLLKSRESLSDIASEASVVAEVIYEAATDGTDQLRYTAGEDAKEIIANRKQLDDATFIGGIKVQIGL